MLDAADARKAINVGAKFLMSPCTVMVCWVASDLFLFLDSVLYVDLVYVSGTFLDLDSLLPSKLEYLL